MKKPVLVILFLVSISLIVAFSIILQPTPQFETPLFVMNTYDEDYMDDEERYSRVIFTPNQNNLEFYELLGPNNSDQTTIVIIPLFTKIAYTDGGFYDYYSGKCSEQCLTIGITESTKTEKYDYRSSVIANQILQILGYDRISDADLHVNPSIISNYDRVIMLHNEYVTQEIFDAVTAHPKVIYLYPNALYAEITADVETNSIKLIKGHGYPEKSIKNGFDWKNENTHPYEFDNKCENWEFYQIDQGYMLNCYPEKILPFDVKLLETLRKL